MSSHFLRKPCLTVLLLATALNAIRVEALPENPDVTFGNARFDVQAPGVLAITASPKTIIQWQDFSIRPNESVRFVQQGANSAVLNRVTGQNPSELLGQLHSNGRVYLINPNGILLGEGAVVDTRGFLASTLAISDQDFMRNHFVFTRQGDGQIRHQGLIQIRGDGSVILLADRIENQGSIQTESGQIVLAAGEKLTLSSLESPEIRFEIQSATQQVVNLGELRAGGGGAASLFAGTLTQQGRIEALSASRDAEGRIVLSARNDLTLTEDARLLASGPAGGRIHLESQQGTARIGGTLTATHVDLTGNRIETDAVIASNAWQLSNERGALQATVAESARAAPPLRLQLTADGNLTQTGPIQADSLLFSGQLQVQLEHADNRTGRVSGQVNSLTLAARQMVPTVPLQVESLQATGAIEISHQGAVRVSGPLASQDSAIRLRAHSPLTVAGALTADTDLVLAAGDGTALDDVLRFGDNTTLTTRHGTIELVFHGELQGARPILNAPAGSIRYNGRSTYRPWSNDNETETVPPLDTDDPQTVGVVQAIGSRQNNQVVVLTQQSSALPEASGSPDDPRRDHRAAAASDKPGKQDGSAGKTAPACR